MKLWILKNIRPNGPHYDVACGFVVRAENENHARVLIHSSRLGDDGYGDEGPDTWIDSTLSTCNELTPDGDAAIILRDFAAG